jgi:protein-S-isoprenylcysteine O-methyltransferase Ste14
MATAQNEQGGARVHFPPPLVFLGAISAGVALQHLVAPLSSHFPAVPRLAVGALFTLGGVLLFGGALRWFKRTGQHPRPWTPTPTLIVEGPYRFSRNPIYVAMTAVQVSIGLALDDLWIVGLAVPSLVAVHFIAVLPEERYLSEKFGESYRQYLSRVRRYL